MLAVSIARSRTPPFSNLRPYSQPLAPSLCSRLSARDVGSAGDHVERLVPVARMQCRTSSTTTRQRFGERLKVDSKIVLPVLRTRAGLATPRSSSKCKNCETLASRMVSKGIVLRRPSIGGQPILSRSSRRWRSNSAVCGGLITARENAVNKHKRANVKAHVARRRRPDDGPVGASPGSSPP